MKPKPLLIATALFAISALLYAQSAPAWVSNLEQAFPSRDWVAVTAQGISQAQAEASAMNALARAFRTDVESLTQSSQQFSQIVGANGNITFDESRNFTQEIQTSTNIRGLIAVQLDSYQAPDRTFYVNARMNRRESALRYSGMVRENTAIINRLLASAAAAREQASFDVYSKLSFAHSIAIVTDSFQNILEVLDPGAANQRPSYGGANAIKVKMLECAAQITIAIVVDTEQAEEKTLLTRAAASFFSELGFRTNEDGSPNSANAGNYFLRVNARFEVITQNVISCRYFMNAALTNRNGTTVFSFTEDDRKAHPNNAAEARRLAVRAVETSFKEGKFSTEFGNWLNSLLD